MRHLRTLCVFVIVVSVMLARQAAADAGFADSFGKAQALGKAGKNEEAVTEYQAAVAAAGTDDERYQALSNLGVCCAAGGRQAEARKYDMQAIEVMPPSRLPEGAWTAKALIDASVTPAELQEAVSFLENAIRQPKFDVLPKSRNATRFFVAVGYGRMGNLDKAVETLGIVVADPATEKAWKGDALALLAGFLGKQGKYTESLDAVVRASIVGHQNVSPDEMARVEVEAIRGVSAQKKGAEAVTALRDALVSGISSRRACDMIQQALVDVLTGAGRYPEACHEAKILVETSAQADIPKAVATTAALLKAADGNLKRANAFLEYQKFLRAGPDGKLGTADDLQDPLAKIQRPDDPAWDAKLRQAMDSCPKTWNGYLDRARVCRYLENPVAALQELKLAFALAPMESTALQQVTNETVEVLLIVMGDLDVGKRFADYQKYGAAGQDEKPGTADDLKNPVDECLAAVEPAQPKPAPKP